MNQGNEIENNQENKSKETKENSNQSINQERFTHTCYPIYNEESRVLLLGTFPSVKSRETMFYYGHPQNRFWKVLAKIFDETVPTTNEEKKELLLRNHVALWDVIESCEVTGSSDSSIRNVVPNDVTRITEHCDIRQIYGNGEMSVKLYKRYLKDKVGREIIRLPSSSPANANFSLDRLVEEWRVIRDEVKR